jgi:hypothetical protein
MVYPKIWTLATYNCGIAESIDSKLCMIDHVAKFSDFDKYFRILFRGDAPHKRVKYNVRVVIKVVQPSRHEILISPMQCLPLPFSFLFLYPLFTSPPPILIHTHRFLYLFPSFRVSPSLSPFNENLGVYNPVKMFEVADAPRRDLVQFRYIN